MDNKKKSGSMDYVDSDVMLNILSRVPTESISVCKSWGNLLTKKYFIDMHVCRQMNQLHGSDCDDTDVSKVDMGFLFTAKEIGLYKYESLYHGRLLLDDKIHTDEDLNYKIVTRREIMKRPSMPTDMLWEYLVGSCNGLVCLGRYHDDLVDPICIFNPITRDYTYLPKFTVPKEYHPRYHYLTRGFGYVGSTNEYKVVRIYYPDNVKVGQVQVYTLGSSHGWRNKCIPFPPVNSDQIKLQMPPYRIGQVVGVDNAIEWGYV